MQSPSAATAEKTSPPPSTDCGNHAVASSRRAGESVVIVVGSLGWSDTNGDHRTEAGLILLPQDRRRATDSLLFKWEVAGNRRAHSAR